jgi:Holliday junction resolvase RusA-like endonuclease
MWAKWYVYDGYKKKWFKILPYFLRALPISQELKMHITIVSHRKRLLDEDNLHVGAKPIFDYLQRANYLKDDNPKWCSRKILQEISDIEKTTIIISKIGDSNEN